MNEVKIRLENETKIVAEFVKSALESGYNVSLFDSEVWTVKRSKSFDEIMGAINTADEDTLKVRNDKDENVGSVFFVYGNGNGSEVICDYSAFPEIERLLEKSNKIADELSE